MQDENKTLYEKQELGHAEEVAFDRGQTISKNSDGSFYIPSKNLRKKKKKVKIRRSKR